MALGGKPESCQTPSASCFIGGETNPPGGIKWS